jgi:rhamnose transport system substrate-binding protein
MRRNLNSGGIAALVLVAATLGACGSDDDATTVSTVSTSAAGSATSAAASSASSAPTSAGEAATTDSSGSETSASESSTAASADVPTSSPSSCASDATVEPRTGDEISLVYIPKNLGNPYFDSIVAGLEEAGADLNIDVSVVGPAQAGATDQIQYIDAAVQQHVDAILISPNDPDAVKPSLVRAMDEGIRVLSVNSDMNVDGREVAILPVDFTTLGDFLVELTKDVTGGTGDFAILSATSTAPDQNTWIDGVKAALDAGAAPDLNLVDVVYGDDEPDKSANETRALLTKYPDLTAIVAPTTVGVAAAAQVLSTSPLKGELQVTGLGTPNQMRQYIEDGTVTEFALWDPKAEGILAAHLVAGLIDGTVTADAGETFTVPCLGERTITADTQIITGPPTIFDASNIDQFNF